MFGTGGKVTLKVHLRCNFGLLQRKFDILEMSLVKSLVVTVTPNKLRGNGTHQTLPPTGQSSLRAHLQDGPQGDKMRGGK
ncbi:hypothetical protein JOQ06_006881, partial [Pogonophryne albipinna]